MPTIEFSSVAMTAQMGTMYSVGGSAYSTTQAANLWTPLLTNGEAGNERVRINAYKGTRPTTRPTLITAFSSDLLVSWAPNLFTASVGPVTQSMVGTTHTLQIISQLTNASASGAATWFAIANYNTSTNVVYGFVTGSVGLPGSGADLIITDTNIVSGQQYKIANLTLTQTSVFTY